MVAAGRRLEYNHGVPKENTMRDPGRKKCPEFWKTFVLRKSEENMMKKITRRSFLTVCGAVAAAAALSACGGSASSTAASSAAASSTAASSVAASAAGDLSGNVATGGSTSMKNVIAALTEGFAEVQPGVTVSYAPHRFRRWHHRCNR